MNEENTLLLQQLEIVKTRWPNVYHSLVKSETDALQVSIIRETTISINGTQLTSAWDRRAEAELQAGQLDKEASTVFLYGAGLGDCANLLLERKQLQQLHIIILCKAVFLHTLALIEHKWLQDMRTHLHLPAEFSDIQLPFIANPAEMILADKESCAVRDCLELELNHAFVQRKHKGESAINQQRIAANIPFLEKDSDISFLPARNPKEIFIAAAGPTLEDHFEWLHANDSYLIAVDAAVGPLLANDIRPDLIVSIDAHAWQLFANIPLAELQETPLIYMPSVDTELLLNWPGPRYYAYSETPMYASLPEKFCTAPLFSAGSVIHPATDLATTLKARTIIFLGADFSFVDGKSHATAKKSSPKTVSNDRTSHWVWNMHGAKVPTLPNLKGYLRELERYIERHSQVSFFNGSAKGAEILGTQLWKP